MNKEEVLKKMAALCLAVYGKKEKIPTNVERYMLANPLKGIGLMMQRREMPTQNEAVMEILAGVGVADLDFDKPANLKEQGSWHIAMYQNKGTNNGQCQHRA